MRFTEEAAYIAQRAYSLNEKARKNDLACLKDDVITGNNTRDIFEYGIKLCANIIDSDRLDKILSNLINHECGKEEKRLKLIKKEAVTYIQKGYSSAALLHALFSYLDESELAETLNYLRGTEIYTEAASLLEINEQKVYNETADWGDKPEAYGFQAHPFDFIYQSDKDVLLEQLKQEQSDVAAYILAFIEPQKAAYILSNLPAVLQSGASYRVAVMDNPSLKLLRDVLRLEKKLLSMSGKKFTDPENGEFAKVLNTYLVRQDAVGEAKDLYEKSARESAGSKEAVEIANRLTDIMRGRPFDFIRTNAANFLNMLQNEHPKTIAYVLCALNPGKAAIMLQFLPPYLQCDAARRIAKIDNNSDEIRRIEKSLSILFGKDCPVIGGVEKLAELLLLTDRRETSETIMDYLENTDPELVPLIKENLFSFDDIEMLSDIAVQKVFRGVDSGELAKALKNTNEIMQEKCFRNMSRRAAVMLKEEIECMRGVSDDECMQAQKKIVSIIRHLEEMGEIILARYGDDEFVV